MSNEKEMENFELEFKSPRKVANGYSIKLTTPYKIWTPAVYCPFGVDQESDWKWSIKFNLNSKLTQSSTLFSAEVFESHREWIEKILVLEYHVHFNVHDKWFPSTAKEYFIMRSILSNPVYNPKKENSDINADFQMRAKVPIKYDIARTYFTGNAEGETQRLLTLSDSSAISDPSARVRMLLEWDSVYVTEDRKTNRKTIGLNWTVKEVMLC